MSPRVSQCPFWRFSVSSASGLLVLTLLCAGCLLHAAPATVSPDDSRLGWWRDARLGLFIHWGPVSLAGTEIGWSRASEVPAGEYDELYRAFNPERFDARAWARLARDMGAGYLVLTSKHHDGFCLWQSQHTDYDIASTPFERDVMDELSQACRREGIVFCTYHSICDWWHPDYPRGSPGGKTQKPDANMGRYRNYLHNQVTEIIQDYGPIGIMWFDGEWEEPWTESMGRELYALCRRLQPDILVNNRVAKGRQGMSGTTRSGLFAGDYDTPEQEVGQYQVDRPWESCITLCNQWAWKPEDPMKPLPELIKTLVNCVGGDGNLLLNVGPMPTGDIEPRQAARLRKLGQWLKANGRSVYGTRGGPFRPGAWGSSTHRGSSVFLHVLDWQGSDRLQLPAQSSEIQSAKTLAGRPVHFYRSPEGFEILRPAGTEDDIDTIIELVMPTGSRLP